MNVTSHIINIRLNASKIWQLRGLKLEGTNKTCTLGTCYQHGSKIRPKQKSHNANANVCNGFQRQYVNTNKHWASQKPVTITTK
jgi:hypothetical protein